MKEFDRAGRPLRSRNWRPPRPPANKGKRYNPSPPSASDILRAVNMLGESAQDLRLAALIAILWRAGLGLSEALALNQDDYDADAGVVSVKGTRRAATRKASMDAWGFERLARWQEIRHHLPAGPLFCILRGPTAGQNWGTVGARSEIRRLGQMVGAKQFTPQQLRYAHAAELLAQGILPAEVYRQLGLSPSRNNRLPTLMLIPVGRGHASQALKPPGAEKLLLGRGKATPPGEAYALVRRAAQATDDSYRQARTRVSRRAWSDALLALHTAEEKIMLATAEDFDNQVEDRHASSK